MRILHICCFLALVSFSKASRSDWIDPHDMNTNAKQKLQRSMSEKVVKSEPRGQENKLDLACSVDETICLMFLKRAVSLILNSAIAENEDPSVYTGSYHFKMDTEEHRFLIDFANKKTVNDNDIRKLDTVLSAVFVKPDPSIFIGINISKEDIYSILFQINTLIMLAIFFCLYITYYLMKNNYGFWYILSYFFCLILIIDYAERYRFLYEEAEQHNLSLLYSENCDTSKMNWSSYFKFVVSSRDCERRIVTPLQVSLNQLKYIIIIPLESLGTGMGKFGKELWANLPFPWNIIIFPLMLIFIILMMFMFSIAVKESPFKLNLMHLFSIQFGKPYDDSNRISGATLDKLLDATTHRPMVQDIKSSSDIKNSKRNKDKRKKSPPKQRKEKEVENERAENDISKIVKCDGDSNHFSEDIQSTDVLVDKSNNSDINISSSSSSSRSS